MKTVTFCLASLMIIVLVSFFLTGCSLPSTQTNAHSLEVPADCVKLWGLDLGEDYQIGGSYFARWLGEDLDLELIVYRGSLTDMELSQYEKVIVDGITCYTNASAINWDGTNESGEWTSGIIFSQTLVYEQNGLVCTLAANSGNQEISPDVVSLKTAQSLMDPSASEDRRYRKISETWTAGFQKGILSGGVSIIPPPLDQAAYERWANSENCSFVKDGDLEYYLLKHDDQEDSPNSRAIAFRSRYGLIEIRAGVPYKNRHEVPREELDFVNMELVNQVIQLVFAE